jgi:putative transposase
MVYATSSAILRRRVAGSCCATRQQPASMFCKESLYGRLHKLARRICKKFDVEVHGWVFMTNHVHLLLTSMDDPGISKLMQTLGRLYVRYFNYGYHRTARLFEGRYRSRLVQQEAYFLSCLRCIELNPARAEMTIDAGDY